MLLPFFSMVDRRRSLHHDIIASTREQFPPDARDRGAVLERDRTHELTPGTDTGIRAWRGRGADLCGLWAEVVERMDELPSAARQ